jgi:hypothetical protein
MYLFIYVLSTSLFNSNSSPWKAVDAKEIKKTPCCESQWELEYNISKKFYIHIANCKHPSDSIQPPGLIQDKKRANDTRKETRKIGITSSQAEHAKGKV